VILMSTITKKNLNYTFREETEAYRSDKTALGKLTVHKNGVFLNGGNLFLCMNGFLRGNGESSIAGSS